MPWAFLTPALIILGLFVAWPLIRAGFWSFFHVSILDTGSRTFSGWSNYSWMLSDPRFRQAFANTAWFTVMVVPIQTTLAFFLALWVNRPETAWRWLRTVFFIPVILSMPVLAVLWRMLYQPVQGAEAGLINQAVMGMGLSPQDWLNDPNLALPAIAFMSVWQGTGFQMMIFLAGLQTLSTEQIEAAKIDGASAVQRLIHILIPGMKHSILFVGVTTTLLCFRLFVQPYLMTRGGPEDSTVSLIQMIYETTFLHRDLGLAGAGTMLFVSLVLVIAVVHRILERREA
jgi:ABC-type sugar transport system permease subunit